MARVSTWWDAQSRRQPVWTSFTAHYFNFISKPLQWYATGASQLDSIVSCIEYRRNVAAMAGFNPKWNEPELYTNYESSVTRRSYAKSRRNPYAEENIQLASP